MSILRWVGFGERAVFAKNCAVKGIVTDAKRCWWFKVNTKPVRRHALDGAMFPHIIGFTYAADGKTYSGKRFIHWNLRCPQEGERITVYFDPADPTRYAVKI